MRALRSKKLLSVGLVAVLALGLTACELEKGPNDTETQAAASNAFVYSGGTFEGGGALRQAQYPTLSSATDAGDNFVLRARDGAALPSGRYNLAVTLNQDPNAVNHDTTWALLSLEYRDGGGRWVLGGNHTATCHANVKCLGDIAMDMPAGFTEIAVLVGTCTYAPYGCPPPFAGTYGFKLSGPQG